MSDRLHFHQLFANYVAGIIGPEQLEKLNAALCEDADLRRDLIEYLNLDSAISDLAAVSDTEVAEVEAKLATARVPTSRTTAPWHRRLPALAIALAACLLLAFVLWKMSVQEDEEPTSSERSPSMVAELVAQIDARLSMDSQLWKSDKLTAGAYHLERGLLHLKFGNGVKVFVEAPARFDAVTAKRLVLRSGRLSAKVPSTGAGFTVETPEARVVDFGTEFAIEVDRDQSEVHVFDGLVRVHPLTRKATDTMPSLALRASQAARIDKTNNPVSIQLARHRFIRNFDEPKRKYPRSVRRLGPVAYYRMPIRARGLYCHPAQYSGEVLTGEGRRPPHAPGFSGASLRVQANSTGRGARVSHPPPLVSGQFTLVVSAYADSRPQGATLVTNLHDDQGNFALSLDRSGLMRATIREDDGELKSCRGSKVLPLTSWCHLIMTANGDRLRLYENGQLVASTECSSTALAKTATLWIGTSPEGKELWDGRIDELALFDRALGDDEVSTLYQAARDRTEELD